MSNQEPTTPLEATPLEGEVDVEDFTPETLTSGQEIIDGEFVIDGRGIKRLRNGRLAPGQNLNPAGKPKGAGAGLRYREFKQSMVLAFHQNGGTAWLARWGRQNPSQFFRLMGRMLPLELQGQMQGKVIYQLALPPTALDGYYGEGGNPLVEFINAETGEIIEDPYPKRPVKPEP